MFYRLQAGHRVPRFSMINWALCVPSTCTHLDVEHSLGDYVQNLTAGTGISFELRVEERMCQTNDRPPLEESSVNAL